MTSRRTAAPFWSARQILGGMLALTFVWLVPGTAGTAEPAIPGVASAPAESASEPVSLPQPLTPQTIRALVARLDDDQVRELLLTQLDRTAAAAADPAPAQTLGLVDELEVDAGRVRNLWAERLSRWPQVPGELAFLGGRLAEGKAAGQLLLTVVGAVMIFAAGVAAERLFWHLTAKQRASLPDARVEHFTTRLASLLQRLVWQVLGLVVFGVAALLAFFALYQGHGPTRLMLLTYLAAILLLRLAAQTSRFLLAPQAPALRLVPFDDHTARGLHRWVLALAAIASFGLLTGDLLGALDLDHARLDAFLSLVTVLFVATLIAAIVWARRPVAALILAGTDQPASPGGHVRDLLARSWHVLAILYVLGIWISGQVRYALDREASTAPGLVSLLLIVALPLADAALRRLVADYFAAKRAHGTEAGAIPEPHAYEPAVARALRVVLWLVGVVVFMRVWDIDIYTVTQQGIGDTAAGALFNIVVTVVFAYVGWELVKAAIDRRVEQEGPAPAHGESGEAGGHGASRLSTLLPLARKAIFATLVVMVAMIVLSSLGVDIGPLLAGAGVVGLAVGFGAQTLVRDIVSGVFFLLDDAFRVGEYIDLGEVMGTVEKISIRSMQLRHQRGALNTVPFGEIRYLKNYSRDWAIMKLEFRVTYDTDVALVKTIFKQINSDLMADPEIAPNLLAPLKSQGVLSMEDSAMVVRAKFTAKPGEQFIIRREVYSRVQKAFDDAGIKFAHRQVTVHVPEAQAIEDARPGTVREVAGAAARRVLEDEDAAVLAAKASA